MSAKRSIRLSAIVATLFTTVVAPVFVSLVNSSIKAESTMQARCAAMRISLKPISSSDLSQATVILLPPLVAPSFTLAAPRVRHDEASATLLKPIPTN
jgi:hypothetical protein